MTSRFVQRIAALAGARWNDVCERGENYLALARALDQPADVKATARPAPTPPLAARPSRLSVTAIEDWLRDPYTIYARYVLRLPVLDPVDTPPGARDRGTVIHGAIGDFTTKFTAGLPSDALAELRKLGEQRFAPLNDYPEAKAFWWPRFLRIAQWFVTWDGARRATINTLHAEIKGELKFPIGKREFTIEDAYAFEGQLSQLYPGNRNVKPKIRQQLQSLRDRGYLEFVSRGYYRLRSIS